MQRQTVTVEEASAALGFSRAHGYRLVSRGEFPCRVIKAGERVVVPRAELERILGLVNDQREQREDAGLAVAR